MTTTEPLIMVRRSQLSKGCRNGDIPRKVTLAIVVAGANPGQASERGKGVKEIVEFWDPVRQDDIASIIELANSIATALGYNTARIQYGKKGPMTCQKN